jgi:4a-hydroxytetrahydrobiopterin dehydratase
MAGWRRNLMVMAAPLGWEESGGALRRELTFKDFSEAWGFMARVALVAQQMDHHPTWTNTWNKVALVLTSHDAGSTVTDRDVAFAEAVNTILG